jgi:hypothetical protein
MADNKVYSLHVWVGSTETIYEDVLCPLIGRPTNDVAIVFITLRDKEIIVSSNLQWILVEYDKS